MKPYFEQGGITIYHARAEEILPLACESVITDPPYGAESLGGGYGRKRNYGGEGRKIAGDVNLDIVREIAPLLWKSLPDASLLFTFCASRKMLEHGRAFEDAGFDLFGELIWDKMNPGLGYTIRYMHESILVFHKGEATKAGEPILSIRRECVDRNTIASRHPHEKPVSVLSPMLSLTEGVILDPFVGSGSTLIAAKLAKRKAIGIECEERYCEIAANRILNTNPLFDEPRPETGNLF